MPRARLTLTLPADVWIGEVSRAHPEVRIRVLAALVDDGTGVAHAEFSGPDVPEALRAVDESGAVTALDLLHRTEDAALVQFETTTPLLLLAAQDSGVPLELPFDIQDGRATWDIAAPHERLSALGDQLEAFGVEFTVEHVRERVSPEPVLTERQESLVRTAAEMGYYDVPRACTLTDVAEAADVAKSTCSETLHRAESRIVSDFLETDGNTTLK